MGKFVLRRLIQAIPTLLGLSVISFVLVHVVPGGPVDAMLGPRATPARVALLNHLYGFDKPLPVQYLVWLWQLLHGNLGVSYFYNQPVTYLLMVNLPRTLTIVGIGIIVAHLISIVLGTFQGYWRNSVFDYVTTTASYFFYSMPVFWLGVILIVLFSVDVHWFPSGGIANSLGQSGGFTGWLSHITLPIVTIVVVTVAGWARYMRSSVIDTLIQDYIRTARAKGIGERAVLFKHTLRNSILPLITLLGLTLPAIFSGALFVEVVFNYPGLGLLFWTATVNRDFPIILGGTILIGVLTIIGNLVADILFALIDPRVSFE